MTHDRPTLDQTVMMVGACFLFLGGLMIGAAFNAKGAPIIGMAHTLGLLEAVYMFAFVAVRPYVRFSLLNTWIFVGLTFLSFYCNFAGVCLTVLTGAGAGAYLPPWDAYLTNDPTAANRLVWFLLNMSAAAMALPVMLIMGWFDRAQTSKVLQIATTVISLLLTAALLYFMFFAIPA